MEYSWEMLAARLDLVLITGDRALLLDKGMSGRIVSPAQFIDGGATSPSTE